MIEIGGFEMVGEGMSKHWNADDWHLYLSQLLDARANFPNGMNMVALKIAETMDELRVRAKLMLWQTIDNAPSDGSKIIVTGGRHGDWDVADADGEWWRRAKKDGSESVPTNWMVPPRLAFSDSTKELISASQGADIISTDGDKP